MYSSKVSNLDSNIKPVIHKTTKSEDRVRIFPEDVLIQKTTEVPMNKFYAMGDAKINKDYPLLSRNS